MIKLNEEVDYVKIDIIEAKLTNEYTATLNRETARKFVLSKYQPRQTIDTLFNAQKGIDKNTIWILLGYGFGYLVDKIMEEVGEQAKILVIEPNHVFLEQQLQIRGKTKADFNNIKYITNQDIDRFEEIVREHFVLEELMNLNFIALNGYIEFYPVNSSYYMNKMTEIRSEKFIEQNTMKAFSKKKITNLMNNIEAIKTSYDIRQHKEKYKGIPAVIVSAGPSLNKNIEHLKYFKGLILCMGRSSTALTQIGIKPDILVSLDPTDLVYETFMDNKGSDTPLITIGEGNDLVVKHNQGIKYFLKGPSDMEEKLLGINCLERIPSGGSVANFAASVAEYLGCSPIVFIGQDLAYTDNKEHASMCVSSIDAEDAGRNRIYQYVEGYHGDQVVTDMTLLKYLRWFEVFISEHPDTLFINATEGGAKIQGTMQMTLEEVIQRYSQKEKATLVHNKQYVIKNKETMEEKTEQIVGDLKRACELVNKGKYLTEKLYEEYIIHKGIRESKIKNILKRMDKEVEEELFVIKEKGCMYYIFAAIANEVLIDKEFKEPLKENELEKSIRIAKMNKVLYTKLKSECDELLDLIIGGDYERKD